jgi:hypothetical protein
VNLARQRRRLYIAMAITGAALVVALTAAVGLLVLHQPWAIWPFSLALLIGFGSHGWLMLGVLRDKAPSA